MAPPNKKSSRPRRFSLQALGLEYQGSGQLIVDNGGSPSFTNTALGQVVEPLDLTVSGGAKAALGSTSVRSLLVGPNSWLTFTCQTASLIISSNASVQAEGGITVDGMGSVGGSGTGAGHSLSSPVGLTAGGGGYGGNGGSSLFGVAGGVSYGSVMTLPTAPDSGGGNTTGLPGGAGGGRLTVTVNGTLALDGRLSADGLPGGGPASGGGSGGSLYVSVGILGGAGVISAGGGAGDPPYGGGGSGGRIAIFYGTNQFSGGISAFGGPGAVAGGAGTVYLAPKGKGSPQLIVNNGGQRGTNTPLYFSAVADLAISGGAVVTPTSLASLNSLTIGSNSWMVYSNGYQTPLTVAGNATIQNGGGISLNGAGFGIGVGPGAAGSAGGGGGYGGIGASSATGAAGGTSYGSLQQPTDLGSGGGRSSLLASTSFH